MTLGATVAAPAIFVCLLTSAARSHHLGGKVFNKMQDIQHLSPTHHTMIKTLYLGGQGGHVKAAPVVGAVPGDVASLVALLALFPVQPLAVGAGLLKSQGVKYATDLKKLLFGKCAQHDNEDTDLTYVYEFLNMGPSDFVDLQIQMRLVRVAAQKTGQRVKCQRSVNCGESLLIITPRRLNH